MQRIQKMRVVARDVFIASFPKSGTTLTQQLVYQLISASAVAHDGLRHISDFSPFLEADRTWEADIPALAEPAASLHRELGWRAYNTHLLPSMLPVGEAKILYVLREPKDVCTSMWHHFSHMAPEDGGYPGSLEQFVTDWLAGSLAFGSWRAHVDAWLRAARTDERILLVRYEDLISALPAQVRRIRAHLCVQVDQSALEQRVLPRLPFSWMAAHAEQFEPRTVRWVSRNDDREPFRFLRRGNVGDASNLLDAALRGRIDAATALTAARMPDAALFARDGGPEAA
jgi:hypothetical protein